MALQPDVSSWFGLTSLETGAEQLSQSQEFERLWHGFMTARIMLGLVLLLLQGGIYSIGISTNFHVILLCIAYLAATISVRLVVRPRPLGKNVDRQWIAVIGVDILAFAALQATQGNNINYAPLLVLPILMASVLGPLLLALAVAAAVTLLMFVYATWLTVLVQGDAAAHFLQAALTGAGYFVISFLAHQIASRLANVELSAERSQLAIRVQRKVNELVIESLTDGILVLDPSCLVRAANPAARVLLGGETGQVAHSLDLAGTSAWQGLVDLAQLSFATRASQQSDVTIHHAGQGPRRVRIRTQLTSTTGGSGENLCVMFVQDQREMEARLRTEKLASMGRMSAAVAHEIRNPLAAITQANALLDEDLTDPRQKRLTHMVQQNARRLEKIVADVLNISSLQQRPEGEATAQLELNQAVSRICSDWQNQTQCMRRLRVDLSAEAVKVRFEAEDLRRILVNLLDNAIRHASGQDNAIQVAAGKSTADQSLLRVWSDGQPMDQSVERHLFEPFFSSNSRSSGLGLYICRELCEKYGASIAYHRTWRSIREQRIEGNEFLVSFLTC